MSDFYNKYPYTDFHELNLDWILKTVRNMEETLSTFTSLNKIKYADPLYWDITKSYEANTIVLDAASGIAYISLQAVPAGIYDTNTEYWGEVFNIAPFSNVFVSPELFGAKGDGITDDTDAFNQCIASGLPIVIGPRRYLTEGLAFNENSIIIFNNSVIIRKGHATYLIDSGLNSTCFGHVELIGNKDENPANTETGFNLADGTKFYGTIISHDNGRHGIRIESNTFLDYAVSYDNGTYGTSAGDGRADGVYIINGKNVTVNHVVVYGNYRSGLVATTYNPVTETPDITLSDNINIKDVKSYDNIYTAINFEIVRGVTLDKFETDNLSCSGDQNIRLTRGKMKAFYSATAA